MKKTKKKSSRFYTVLHWMYGIGFLFVAGAAIVGAPYYSTPLAQRPHSAMHENFKPGGLWGHGIGIVGSTMVLLLFLYSARKRGALGLRKGPLNKWLDVHIFFGVMGPLLITLHTAMKFGGIVSISYFSMLLVALSGVFGRYVYVQIPRDSRGAVLGVRKAEERITAIRSQLQAQLPAEVVSVVDGYLNEIPTQEVSGFRALVSSARYDLTLPRRTRRLRRLLRERSIRVPESEFAEIVGLVREQMRLRYRIARVASMTRALHYWHVFHKPFAYIMVTIMFVHIAIAVSFGYKWVF